MSVPFTQLLRPDGRRLSVSVDRSPEIEALAQSFIAGGGWFEAEVLLPRQDVAFTACLNVDGEARDLWCTIAANGPDVEAAVDDLIRHVAELLPAAPLPGGES